MSMPEHYLITVALHAAVLSAVVFLVIVLLRKPQRIAVTALCGTLAVAILPWISAMGYRQHADPDESVSAPLSAVTRLPQWKVIHIPIEEETLTASPAPAKPPGAIAMPKLHQGALAARIWALGSTVVLISLIMAAAKVLRWRRTLADPDDIAWQALREAEPHLPARRHFRISAGDGSPCVAGFFMPVVVIPRFLLDPAKRRELGWALRHELRHLQGSDSRWTIVLEALRVSQWWNPFVHVLISRWKMAREHICDLAASEDDRATYGEFLIAMAAKTAPRHRLAVTMVRRQRLHSLKARIVTVLSAAPGTVTKLEKSVLFSACAAFTGAALMISCVRIGATRHD
ncbi:MAG: M56 family metallopeptidase, partial [Verrucomicrobiaceae bacterium]